MADDGESIFAKAGFDLPGKTAAASEKKISEKSAAPSIFEAAGFKIPGGAKEAAPEIASNIPTPERFAATPRAPAVKSTLQEIHEAIDPSTLLTTGAKNAYHDTIENAVASSHLAGQGLTDIGNKNYLPTMPSADPSTWSPGGLLKTAGGALGVLASPITGTANALVAKPVTALTGNPDIGERAGFVASALVPIRGGGAVAEKVAPSTKAVNKLAEAVGPENVPEIVARLRENPRLTLADVSDPVRTMTQGLIDPAQPGVQNLVAQRVKERASSLPSAVNTAYTEAMGPAPDVVKMVEGLKQRATDTGKNIIQPALQTAKPVDVTPVVAMIDKELKPGVQALANPGTNFTPTPLQQSLMTLKKKLTDENGSMVVDPVKLHSIQSDLRETAYQLSTSASGAERLLGKDLYDFRNKLVDQIDAATKTANPIPPKFQNVKLDTPSGKTDVSGVWFLRGDKPTFAQATYSGAEATLGKAASELQNFPSVSGKNSAGHPITVWYKPGEQAKAQKAVDLFSKGAPSDVAGEIKYHLENGEALGYSKRAAESYVRQRFGDAAEKALGPEGLGPYKEGLQKFRDAKQIHEAFDAGFDTLKNRSGLKGLEDRPEALKEWVKDATPEEVVARRIGTRADIDQKIRSAKNQALAGESIIRIEYNQEKLRTLFGEKEANRLIRVMKDAQDEAATNAKLLAGSKTAETLAGQKALEVRKVGGGNPLQYVAPVAAEMLGQGAGLPGVGFAASLAGKGVHLATQKAGQLHDVARNLEFARNALATGPSREVTINRLLSHPKVVRELKKRSNALTTP